MFVTGFLDLSLSTRHHGTAMRSEEGKDEWYGQVYTESEELHTTSAVINYLLFILP